MNIPAAKRAGRSANKSRRAFALAAWGLLTVGAAGPAAAVKYHEHLVICTAEEIIHPSEVTGDPNQVRLRVVYSELDAKSSGGLRNELWRLYPRYRKWVSENVPPLSKGRAMITRCHDPNISGWAQTRHVVSGTLAQEYNPHVILKADWTPTADDYASLREEGPSEVFARTIWMTYVPHGDGRPTATWVGPSVRSAPNKMRYIDPPAAWSKSKEPRSRFSALGSAADVEALGQAALTLAHPAKPIYVSQEEAAQSSSSGTLATPKSSGLTVEPSLTGPQKINTQRENTQARVQDMAKRTSNDPAVKKRVVSLFEQQYVRAGLAGDASGSCPIHRWDTPGVVTGTGSTEAEARATADAKRVGRTCGLAGGTPQYQPATCNAMTWGTTVDLKTGKKTHRKGWICSVKYVCKNEGRVCPNTGGTRQ